MTATHVPLTAQDIERWNRGETLVRNAVELLNKALGLTDAQHKVTFGYIGNCEPFWCALGSKGDGRYWSVYLPHPGRIGTSDDRLGFVKSGDVEGLFALAGQVLSFRRGVEFVKRGA